MLSSVFAKTIRDRWSGWLIAVLSLAGLLWISPGTVRKHLENAYERLGVHTRTGAVAAACVRESRRP